MNKHKTAGIPKLTWKLLFLDAQNVKCSCNLPVCTFHVTTGLFSICSFTRHRCKADEEAEAQHQADLSPWSTGNEFKTSYLSLSNRQLTTTSFSMAHMPNLCLVRVQTMPRSRTYPASFFSVNIDVLLEEVWKKWNHYNCINIQISLLHKSQEEMFRSEILG